jgi:hypothetical protein
MARQGKRLAGLLLSALQMACHSKQSNSSRAERDATDPNRVPFRQLSNELV